MMRRVKSLLQSTERRNGNNRGAAIVIVIVSVALLCLMVSLILTITFYNFRMKTTDLKAKKTFYTAETAMDEIRAGLQQDVSVAFSDAYLECMQQYVSVTGEQQRAQLFQTKYIQELRAKLEDVTMTDTYSIEHIRSFLKKTAYDSGTNIGAKLEITNNSMAITASGMLLENLVVKYYDKKGYVSEIKTDILLAYPELDFSQSASLLDFLEYTLIANERVDVSQSTLQVKGSAYMGSDGAYFNSSTASFMKTDDLFGGRVITNKQLLAMVGSVLNFTDTELWAKDLVVDSSHATMTGSSRTYLSNDLVINNSTAGASTGIKMAGDYYGYGSLNSARGAASLTDKSADIDKHPSEYSSAILVNGARATVDLSGLNTLMIAGNSYIGASRENTQAASFATGRENEDVAMGESISIKSNQTAYLVPAACVAPGSVHGGANPMTAARYKELLKEVGGNEDNILDYSVITAEYGATLSELGVTGCKVVCYPMQKVGSMVYLFMEFDTEASANSFFSRYYSNAANLTKLQGNLNLYTYGIKVPDNMDAASSNSQFYYNGNIVVNEASKSNFYINKLQTVTQEENDTILGNQRAYQDTFAALNCNLTKDYSLLNDEQRSKDVYGNMVVDMANTGEMKKNISAGNRKIFVTAGANAMGAVVVNGNYVIDSDRVTGQDANGNMTSASLRVVIASGDVTVNHDFNGLVIARGRVIVNNHVVTMEANPTEVLVALNAKNSDGAKALMYLTKFSYLELDEDNSATNGSGNIGASQLVVYQNWKKQ